MENQLKKGCPLTQISDLLRRTSVLIWRDKQNILTREERPAIHWMVPIWEQQQQHPTIPLCWTLECLIFLLHLLPDFDTQFACIFPTSNGVEIHGGQLDSLPCHSTSIAFSTLLEGISLPRSSFLVSELHKGEVPSSKVEDGVREFSSGARASQVSIIASLKEKLNSSNFTTRGNVRQWERRSVIVIVYADIYMWCRGKG